jgi:hypothetical protein
VHRDDLTLAGWRPLAAAIGMAAMLLVLGTACGGGSAAPYVASLGATTAATTTVATGSRHATFSACMRSHGVPDFPDPTFSSSTTKITVAGSLAGGSGTDAASPRVQAAQEACLGDRPGNRRP